MPRRRAVTDYVARRVGRHGGDVGEAMKVQAAKCRRGEAVVLEWP
jgi:hypothetical protein